MPAFERDVVDERMTYFCHQCGEEKNVTRFSKQFRHGAQVGWRSPCKDCVNLRNDDQKHRDTRATWVRNWRRNNPEAAREKYLKQYGLTSDNYDELLQTQGGVCAICGGPSRDGRRLAVDHDHLTGDVRGLLCQSCNVGLGAFADSPETLRSAAAYLERTWIKLTCSGDDCGYIIRTTGKWIEEVGLPTCACGGGFEIDVEDERKKRRAGKGVIGRKKNDN